MRMIRLIAASAALLAACSGEIELGTADASGRHCGNGVCGRRETCDTCPQDCGFCQAPPDADLPGLDAAPPSTPCVGIDVYPTDDLHDIAAANVGATTYCLKAGTHHVTRSIPTDSYDQFLGEPGTILDFTAAILDGQNGEAYGLYGFGGATGQRDVVVRDVVMENCTTDAHTCIALKQGEDWVVENLEVRNNDVGVEGSCTGCYVHHNAVYGLIGGGTVERCEIAYNGGTPDSGGSTGAHKAVHLPTLVWRGNYVHDNAGPGFWCDGCWEGSSILVENNRFENQRGPGIFFEITFGGVARNNTLAGNDQDVIGESCFWGGQIAVQNSEGVEVYGNRIDGTNGAPTLCGIDTPRAETYPTYPEKVTPFSAHDNTIILSAGSWVGVAGDEGGTHVVDASTFAVQGNHYLVDSLSAQHWVLIDTGHPLTFSQWQALGMDTTSTIAIGGP